MSERAKPRERDGEPVNWRRTDEGVEIYEAGNPDAWVRMAFVGGIDPSERLYGICGDCGLVAPQKALPSERMVCGNCGAEFDATLGDE